MLKKMIINAALVALTLPLATSANEVKHANTSVNGNDTGQLFSDKGMLAPPYQCPAAYPFAYRIGMNAWVDKLKAQTMIDDFTCAKHEITSKADWEAMTKELTDGYQSTTFSITGINRIPSNDYSGTQLSR